MEALLEQIELARAFRMAADSENWLSAGLAALAAGNMALALRHMHEAHNLAARAHEAFDFSEGPAAPDQGEGRGHIAYAAGHIWGPEKNNRPRRIA